MTNQSFDSPYKEFKLGGKDKPADDDFDSLATQWTLDPSPANKANILKQIQPVIDPHLRSYGDNAILRGKARLLATQAINTYDPNKGSLKAHIGTAMRGLQRQSAQLSQMVDIPEQVAIEAERLREVENMLEGDLGRSPSDTELSDYIGITPERLAYVRQLRRPTNTGKFTDESGATYTPAAVSSRDTSLEDIWQQMVYYDLSPKDQLIMEHTLGLNGKPILENRQLADKLRVSPGAISQRKNAIQKMLDSRFDE